jgi:hypothetical protein
MSWCKRNTGANRYSPCVRGLSELKGGDVDQNDSSRRDRAEEDLDLEMERDSQLRRDTQVRGSLGIPPSGDNASRESSESSDRDEAVPEFERGSDEERSSER